MNKILIIALTAFISTSLYAEGSGAGVKYKKSDMLFNLAQASQKQGDAALKDTYLNENKSKKNLNHKKKTNNT